MSDRAWTFMVFMAGDNNLSAAGDTDLEEMRRIGSTGEVSVVVEFDNAGSRGTRRIRVERHGAHERVIELGETDSGNPEVLAQFVAWAVKEYPADRYALVLWNHGSGWAPSEMDRIARSVASPGYSERELSERSSSGLGRAFFSTTLEKLFRLSSPGERAICSDDGTGHSLDTIELERVLQRITSFTGKRIDLLGFDACLMANLEVAYQIEPYARYLVGSEETEPAQGWPYDRVLGFLTSHPAAGTAEVAAAVVDSYVQWYGDRGHAGPITQVALDLDELPQVLDPLDTLAREVEASLPDLAPVLWKAQRDAARFYHNTLWDIKDLSRRLEGHSPLLSPYTVPLQEALAPGPGRFVVREGHLGTGVEACGGVSLYMVPPISRISPFYGELAFARERPWHSMLRAYHAS